LDWEKGKSDIKQTKSHPRPVLMQNVGNSRIWSGPQDLRNEIDGPRSINAELLSKRKPAGEICLGKKHRKGD